MGLSPMTMHEYHRVSRYGIFMCLLASERPSKELSTVEAKRLIASLIKPADEVISEATLVLQSLSLQIESRKH